MCYHIHSNEKTTVVLSGASFQIPQAFFGYMCLLLSKTRRSTFLLPFKIERAPYPCKQQVFTRDRRRRLSSLSLLFLDGMHTMRMKHLLHVIVAFAWISVDYRVAAGGAAAVGRSLREIITTTACRNIRRAEDYPARLDLIYVYFLDFYGDEPEVLLEGIERAIATSVASTLNDCDDRHQPEFAVELSEQSEHILIAAGTST